MTNQDSLKQILICKLCNECYEDPIILPCGKSVCSKHVYTESKGDVFKCFICSKKHAIPTESFCKNEDLSQLINISDKYINIESMLGEKNTKAFELCSKLEELINKSELLSKEPSLYVYDYFNELKSDLDLNREQCLKMINDNYNRLLNEIEEAELKCKLSINKLETSVSMLNNSIISSKETLASSVALSKRPDLNYESKWYKFRNEIERAISKSTFTIKKFQSDLLLNKSFQFKLNQTLNENNFGDLLIKSDDFLSEKRLEGTIRFNIDNLKSFRFEKCTRFDKDWCVIDRTRWMASAIMKENENLEQYLSSYVKPDCEKLDQPIKARITFKLLKTNGTVFKQMTFEHMYDKIIGMGYENFCTLKDIISPENEIYDKQNDSFDLEIEIKIIN